MADKQLQFFGGSWTEQKLHMLEEYLKAYVKVLKNQRFQCVYIDAFAGTGYREMNSPSLEEGFFAKELTESEPQEFFDGSARIALRTKPSFSKYIFIERSSKRFEELLKLKTEFVSLADRIVFDKNDCNSVLQDLCRGWDSFRMRGVLFLDPFGMQVEWSTLEAVARTQAIDVWILFPLGVSVNRMLPKDGQVPDAWRERLCRTFGASDWYERFYRSSTVQGFFDTETRLVKIGSFNAIADYYLERLRSIFAGVAENPRVLLNSRNNPLFLLCFAVGNPSLKAKETALKIAQHILAKG